MSISYNHGNFKFFYLSEARHPSSILLLFLLPFVISFINFLFCFYFAARGGINLWKSWWLKLLSAFLWPISELYASAYWGCHQGREIGIGKWGIHLQSSESWAKLILFLWSNDIQRKIGVSLVLRNPMLLKWWM